MSSVATVNDLAPTPSLRLWPALLILLGLALFLAAVALFVPDTDDPYFFIPIVVAPMTATWLLVIWWLFFSRATMKVRFIILALVVVIEVGTLIAVDPGLRIWAGLLAVPFAVIPAVLLWSVTIFLPNSLRVVLLILLMIPAVGWWQLFRSTGSDGYGKPVFSWRWTLSEEERFQAERESLTKAPPRQGEDVEPLTPRPDDWIAFRGEDRQGHGPDQQLNADTWNETPPTLLWKHRVGPGWSAFTIVDGYAFTQEQLGEEEGVICYDAKTGALVWEHRDTARFDETYGGPGPRATPTFHDGRLYTMGGTGILNVLDARTGERLWSVDLKEKYGSPLPDWAFSASPLIRGQTVIVQAGGDDDQPLLAAFDIDTGNEVWTSGSGKAGHCSPQITTLDGVEQLLIFAGPGLFGFDPDTGKQLWLFSWETLHPEYKISQPQVIDDTSVVVGMGYGYGTKRLKVTRDGDAWKVEELWHSKRFKPKFNDYVLHEGALFGFDANRITCLDINTGEMLWRGDSYGYGQLLRVGGELLILSEYGDVAVVVADPAEFREIGRFRAIEGKTWNHPVIAAGKLFVRNGAEAACYDLGPRP